MLLAFFAACADDDTAKLGPGDLWADPDGATLYLEDGALTFTDAGGTERAVHVSLGRVPGWTTDENYDPEHLYSSGEPAGLSWETPSASSVDEATGVATLSLEDGREATLTVDPAGPGVRFTLTVAPDDDYVYARVGVDVGADEEFYGLGEDFAGVRQRGRVRAMQTEVDLDRESSNNEAHVPVPLLVSSAGWGLLVDSWWPGAFDVAAVDTSAVTATFDLDDHVDVDLYGPGAPRDVIARYHQRTGVAEVPPTWAFAPLQWRNEVAGSDVVREDLAAIRENKVPTGLIWIDNPWQTDYNSMVPDPERFPDWDTLVDDLHAAGFRTMAWTTPYLSGDDPEHATYAANGWLIDGVLLLSDFGDFVDLTHPDAAAAWADRAGAAYARGVEGWKLDYGEDIQLGLGDVVEHWSFANGEDQRTMHHHYVEDYHRPYTVAQGGDGFLLGRTGCLGGQTVTDTIWPGDLDSGFEHFDDDCGDDGLCVGGLPAAIRGGTSLAASGYPFYASDTGGFRHDRPTKEAFLRWTEYSAMLPVMQYGGGGDNHNPWDFTDYGTSQFDEETLTLFRAYAQLHIRLFPYFWMLAERHEATGLPIVMAQGVAWPEAGVHTDDSFAIGDDLFVAPVEEEGATTRTLTLPPGRWVHWWTGEAYDGEAEVTVDAPLGVSPLFLREGAAVPLLRRSVQTLSPATDGTDSWAEDPGVLDARIVPAASGGFTLSTGEAVAIADHTLTLTAGSLYTGWDLEVWAPGATGATVDGVALPVGEDGCTACVILGDPWVRVVTSTGTTVVVD